MALIDLSNYKTTLHQASSASFTDGNVFFDKSTTGFIDFGDATTYPTYTPSAATTATTLDTTAPDQITRATGSFTADGWRAGMQVTLAGSATQDGTYEIESISADGLAITTVETSISTESGSGDETLAGAATTNALINLDGLKFEGLYAFENQERRLDENLRKHNRWTAGTFKFGGAYDMVNGRQFADDTARKLIRGSGWRSLTGSTVNRLHFGPKGLGSIEPTSVPYYQSSQYGPSIDFTKPGNIDEAIQVFGDATNGNFDNTLSSHYLSVRTYGKNYDRVDTLGTLGIAELGGYSSGAALNESDHLTTVPATYPFLSAAPDSTSALTSQTIDFTATEVVLNNATAADNDWVELGYGVGSSFTIAGSTTPANDTTYIISSISTTTDTNDTVVTTVAPNTVEVGTGSQTLDNVQVAPFTGMTLEKLASAQTETGFADLGSGTSGDFTWTLNNTGSGTLYECVAYLDAIATINAVVTTGTASLNGKDYDVWYTYTPAGLIQPITGAGDGLGVFIEGLTGADKQLVSFLDDTGVDRVYPTFTAATIEIGQDAIDDPLAWFHGYEAALYDSASAVEYQDATNTVVKGSADNTSPFISGANTFIEFEHDFTSDGTVNTVFICEGDGGVTQQKTAITLGSNTVAASCIPAVENNA